MTGEIGRTTPVELGMELFYRYNRSKHVDVASGLIMFLVGYRKDNRYILTIQGCRIEQMCNISIMQLGIYILNHTATIPIHIA